MREEVVVAKRVFAAVLIISFFTLVVNINLCYEGRTASISNFILKNEDMNP